MISPFQISLKDLQSSQVLCIFNFFAARKKSCNISSAEWVARARQRELLCENLFRLTWTLLLKK